MAKRKAQPHQTKNKNNVCLKLSFLVKVKLINFVSVTLIHVEKNELRYHLTDIR